MRTRRALLVGALVLSVLIAGCNVGGGGDSGTATTEMPGNDSLPEASALQADAADAMRQVEAYRLNSTLNQTQTSNQQEISSEASIEGAYDRTTRSLHAIQTTENRGRTVTNEVYLVDGILYQSNPQVQQQFGSKWVKSDVRENASRIWRLQDELGLHRVMLENATLEVTGSEAVDGTETWVVEVDAEGEAISAYFGGTGQGANLTSATGTFWIAQDSNRLVKSSVTLENERNMQGRELRIVSRIDDRFQYSDVSIELPSAAADAPFANETSGGSN